MKRRIFVYGGLLIVAGVAIFFRRDIAREAAPLFQHMRGEATVSDRVKQYGDAVRTRLLPAFQKQGIEYPPKRIVLVGLKQERSLEVYAAGSTDRLQFIRDYPILAASGKPGPKLREGDQQVPEGIYRIESLNPNSAYHLSLRLNYPNEFDRAQARTDGRNGLGGDIMIHGKSASVGCLAMGDEAVEDLFALVAETGLERVRVILSPVDFRHRDFPAESPSRLPWTKTLYRQIAAELATLPKSD